MTNSEDMIESIIEQKKAHVLYGALFGDNEYFDKEANLKLDIHSLRLIQGALHHLKHLSSLEGYEIEAGHATGYNHEYFKAWMLAGTPGISPIMIEVIMNE